MTGFQVIHYLGLSKVGQTDRIRILSGFAYKCW